MAEQQSGLDEAVQVGTSAASHIRSLRTFSLFAKSAKGAAVAGPLGAALGFAVTNRHTILKILAALLAIPILAILFIFMLPSLIFGSLTDNTGALNDNDLIQKNLRSANQAIVEVLEECHDEVLTEVNADIESLPEGEENQSGARPEWQDSRRSDWSVRKTDTGSFGSMPDSVSVHIVRSSGCFFLILNGFSDWKFPQIPACPEKKISRDRCLSREMILTSSAERVTGLPLER